MEDINLNNLVEYQLNNELRKISKAKFEKLKKDLTKDGQLSPLLVLKDEKNGKEIIIDGNHRYKAMIELGWPFARCERLVFNMEGEGYYATIAGVPQRTQFFKTIDEGIFHYATKRNHPGYATYNTERLMEYADLFKIPYSEIDVITDELPSFAQIVNGNVNGDKIEEKENIDKQTKEIEVTCPKCGEKFKKLI